MTREEIEVLWNDPRNRKWGVYYCKADPRVIVPKHPRWMGWTINAARPAALAMTLLLLAILSVPIWLVAARGAGSGLVLLTAAATTILMCCLCARQAARTK
jgi:hypothetical protein